MDTPTGRDSNTTGTIHEQDSDQRNPVSTKNAFHCVYMTQLTQIGDYYDSYLNLIHARLTNLIGLLQVLYLAYDTVPVRLYIYIVPVNCHNLMKPTVCGLDC